ncbi:phage portal protein [Pseudotabrizicola sp. 4114]|uniref:phage portal protein n=1 Tax=Pseudotabrizicola sp. 4114 TaxID=2817731 RepID=UPI0032B79EB0
MAADTSGTAKPNPALWGDLGWGSQSRVKSLPRVTPIIAQRHATVFACGNVIAGDLAKCPIMVMQKGKKGRDVEVYDHPASYLLNVESSPGVPAMVARFTLIYAYAIRGRSYAYAPRDGSGELTLLDVIRPDRCSELEVPGNRNRYYDFEDGAQVQRRVPVRAMVHLRYMAEDGWTGRSPLEVAAESMGLALAGQEAAARAASGTQMRAFMKMADVYEDDETYLRNARRVRAALNDPDANGIPLIGGGDDIQSLDLSAADQELLASRKFDREQIAAIYRVPPSKLQMLEFGVKANGQQQAIDYKTDCLLHWGGLTEAQLSLGVLTEAERRAGMFLRHDYEALLMATTKERYDSLSRAIGGPWMTWQEGRRLEQLDDLPPGEQPYPPSNMTREDKGSDKKEGTDE